MIVADSFRGQTVGILGLARSGISAAHALIAGGATVFAWDDNPKARAGVPQGVTLENWENWPWQAVKAVVLSPGIPLTHPQPHPIVLQAKATGAEVIGDVDLFARAIRANKAAPGRAPVIAITGTNGKSTTTALIGHILHSCGFDAQVGGNIGKPVLDLDAPGPKTVYVLEISSYQIDLSPNLVPDVSILSNITPDHIDRHGTLENYARVKASLLERTARDGHVVIGTDDAFTSAIYTRLAAAGGTETVAVSVGRVLSRGIFVNDGKLYDAWHHPAEKVGSLKDAEHLPGAHNWQNAALAYGAVRSLIRDQNAILKAILRFPGLAHRIEDVGRIGKTRFVNDSKATNADAAARALACYDDIFWIAGGKAKEGGIESLESFFPRIRKAYLIGDAAKMFAETLMGKLAFEHCGTMDKALGRAASDAALSPAAQPVVLLSPACASFDQFRDFEQRGDLFREAVGRMIADAESAKAVTQGAPA
jgi:UDP-N-acetylmuramoylalanine--D-glutamate ligase